MWPWWVVIPIQDLTVILAIENTVRMIEDEEDEEEEEDEEDEGDGEDWEDDKGEEDEW